MKSRVQLVLVLVLILNKERPKTNYRYLDSRDSSEILRIHHIYIIPQQSGIAFQHLWFLPAVVIFEKEAYRKVLSNPD